MNTPWDVLSSAITRLGDRIDAQPVVREATVYVANPLAVRFDTDTVNTTVQGSLAGGLGVGERVLTLKLRHYVWVLGRKGGVTPWSTVGGIPGWLTGGAYTPDATDLNLAIDTGLYRSGPGCLNQPPTANEFWITRVENVGSRSVQWCSPWTSAETWRRHRQIPGDGSFTPWQLLDKPVTAWPLDIKSGITLGNGTWIGRATVSGGVVFVEGRLQLGSTSAITGDVRIGLPSFAPMSQVSGYFPPAGSLNFNDSAPVTDNAGTTLVSAGGAYLRPHLLSGSAIRIAGCSPTFPFTWASGDTINVSFSYTLAY